MRCLILGLIEKTASCHVDFHSLNHCLNHLFLLDIILACLVGPSNLWLLSLLHGAELVEFLKPVAGRCMLELINRVLLKDVWRAWRRSNHILSDFDCLNRLLFVFFVLAHNLLLGFFLLLAR